MYKNILIATDGSELAGRAVAHGLMLAKEMKAPVTLVTVTQSWTALDLAHETRLGHPNPIRQFEDMWAASAKAILDAGAQKAKAAGVACELVHVADQHPAEGIIAVAEKNGCDLIVMASHGRRAVGRLLLGSQVSEVLAHCTVPALIVR
jgi:nucleotide-binding universal stress UspA family protein